MNANVSGHTISIAERGKLRPEREALTWRVDAGSRSAWTRNFCSWRGPRGAARMPSALLRPSGDGRRGRAHRTGEKWCSPHAQ